MRLDGSIFFSYYTDHYVDATNGLINIDITRGIDKYIGPWQQPDAGVMTLVTRNQDLDPYINPDIRINTKIRVETNYQPDSYSSPYIFTGWISDIGIEYQPNGEPAIITIQAIDAIGRLQKTSISEQYETFLRGLAGNGVTISTFTNYINSEYSPETAGIGAIVVEPTVKEMEVTYAPKAGETYWDVLAHYAESCLGLFIVGSFGELRYLPYGKYWQYTNNAWYYPPEMFPVDLSFASDGSASSYKSILLDAGFDRTINQVSFKNGSRHYNGTTNFDETSTEWGPYIISDSVTEWGAARLDMATLYPETSENNTTFETLARDILEVTANPSIEVLEITYDANKYGFVDIPYKINIKHDVTDTIQINKDYSVVGIKHSINNSEWLSTLILRDYLTVDEVIPEPIIVLNSDTGDTNFNFHAYIENAAELDIASVEWDFVYSVGWGNSGFRSTSLTPTWNYDYAPGKDWYGAGYYYVTVYITTNSGWTKGFTYVPDNEDGALIVTAAVPNAQYTYTTLDGYTTFTDASYDADTWSWNFGDGTTSTLQNPTHTYSVAGTYTVTLTVSNGITTDTETKDIEVVITRLPIRYVKYEFRGDRTKTNVTDTYWTPNKSNWYQIKMLVPTFNHNGTVKRFTNVPTTYTVTTAFGNTVKAYNSSNNEIISNSAYWKAIIPSDSKYKTGSPDNSSYVLLRPLSSTISGVYHQTLNVDIIQDLSLIIDATTPTPYHTIANPDWGVAKYELFDVDFSIIDASAEADLSFSTEVFVSIDGTTWTKIGDLDGNYTGATDTVYNLTNKVTMPPQP